MKKQHLFSFFIAIVRTAYETTDCRRPVGRRLALDGPTRSWRQFIIGVWILVWHRCFDVIRWRFRRRVAMAAAAAAAVSYLRNSSRCIAGLRAASWIIHHCDESPKRVPSLYFLRRCCRNCTSESSLVKATNFWSVVHAVHEISLAIRTSPRFR